MLIHDTQTNFDASQEERERLGMTATKISQIVPLIACRLPAPHRVAIDTRKAVHCTA